MKPATTTFNDAAMAVGQTFADPAGGLSITATAVDAASATITVTIDNGSGAPTCLDGTTLAPPGPQTCAGTGAGGTTGAGGGGTIGAGGAAGASGGPGAAGDTGGGGATATGTGGGFASDGGQPPGETSPSGCGCGLGSARTALCVRDPSGDRVHRPGRATTPRAQRPRGETMTLRQSGSILLLVLVMSVAACGGSEKGPSTGAGGSTTGAAGAMGAAGRGAGGSVTAVDAGAGPWSCVEAAGTLCFCDQGDGGTASTCTAAWTCCFAGPTSCECYDDDEASCVATIAQTGTSRVTTCPQ